MNIQHRSATGIWWAWFEGTYQRGTFVDGRFVEEDLLVDEGL